MIFKRLYTLFQQAFPYMIPHVVKWKSNRATKSIDIWMDDGSVFNFSGNPKSWTLKKIQLRQLHLR